MTADLFDEQFLVGDCNIDRLKGRIVHPDGVHHVPSKAMEVLICLAKSAGDLVTRDDVERHVWGTTHISDDVVTKAISELRHAFGDHPERPKYIQTIPKRGYRLIATVNHEVHDSRKNVAIEDKTPESSESLWVELKRRKVFRVALAYAGIAWLFIQFADIVFPFVGIGFETTSLLIALIILGFPVAVIAAWMIERTNGGLILDTDWLADPKTPMMRRRNLNILITALSIVAITIAANILIRVQPAYTFEARDWIVMTDFDNLTGDELLDESLDRAFKVRLNQSPYVNLLPQNVVRETLVRMEHPVSTVIDRDLASEIAVREDARAVVIASIAKFGSRFSLTAEIVDPAKNVTVTSRAVTADSRDKILDALEQLADGVRIDLGESLDEVTKTREIPLRKVTTSNLEALNMYSIASHANERGDYQSAIDLLHRAIEIDDEFASAHALLGDILANISRPRVEFEPHWQKALSLGDRLPQREKLHIRATMSFLEDPPKMERAWTLVTNVFPDDAEAHHNLGRVYLQYLNQGEQALYSFERATSLPIADRAKTLIYLGYAQLFMNRLEDAVRTFEKALEIDQNPWNFALADGYIALRQYDAAKSLLDDYGTSLSPVFRRYRQMRYVLYHLDRGEFRQSEIALDQAESLFDRSNTRHATEMGLIALAMLELRANSDAFEWRLREELSAIDYILQLELRMSEQGHLPMSILRIAGIAARNGFVIEAHRIYESEKTLHEIAGFPMRIAIHVLLGAELALARDDYQSAIAMLEESLTRVETFSTHEALARAYRAAGNNDQAALHYRWIREHRGHAFGEWHEDLNDRALNVIDWSLAAFHLAKIVDESGEHAKAKDYYDAFLAHWQLADSDLPLLIDAKEQRAEFR